MLNELLKSEYEPNMLDHSMACRIIEDLKRDFADDPNAFNLEKFPQEKRILFYNLFLTYSNDDWFHSSNNSIINGWAKFSLQLFKLLNENYKLIIIPLYDCTNIPETSDRRFHSFFRNGIGYELREFFDKLKPLNYKTIGNKVSLWEYDFVALIGDILPSLKQLSTEHEKLKQFPALN